MKIIIFTAVKYHSNSRCSGKYGKLHVGMFLSGTEVVLTSTHNLCFRAKIRKNDYPCKPQFYYIKVGCKGCTLHGHVFMMVLP